MDHTTIRRWFTPDPAEQFANPYLAMGNNPVNGTDPNGEWFVGSIITGYIAAAKATLQTVWDFGEMVFSDHTWKEFNAEYRSNMRNLDPTSSGTQFNNAIKIDIGAFRSDSDKDPLGRYWQILKRNSSWQMTNTMIGKSQSHLNNILGKVQRVDHFHGATVVYSSGESNGGSSMGGYINIKEYDNSGNAHQTDYSNDLLLHEYGHYLQEQAFGPLTLYSATNSLLSAGGNDIFPSISFNTMGDHDQAWFEQDASARAAQYFSKRNDFNNFYINPHLTALQNFNNRFPYQNKSRRFWWYMPPFTTFHILYTAFINTGP